MPTKSFTAALDKVRTVLRLPAEKPKTNGPDEHLAGATFLEQEPDLMKESGLRTRQISGWAMGGHPAAD